MHYLVHHLRWFSIIFWPSANWFRKSRGSASSWNFNWKSRATSQSYMPTNIVSTFSKFAYRIGWANLLQFQNVYRPDRRSCPSLLDLKEKCARYVGFQPKNAFVRSPRSSNEAKEGNILGYVKDSTIAAHSVDSDIFYTVLRLRLNVWSMWRCDKGSWLKIIWWTMLGQNRCRSASPFPDYEDRNL